MLLAVESQDKIHYAMPVRICCMMDWSTQNRCDCVINNAEYGTGRKVCMT